MNRNNRMIASLVIVSFVSFGMRAAADDSPSDQPVKSHGKLMKECMAEQKAKNSGASKKERQMTCTKQLASYHDHPSATAPATAP